MTTEDILRDMQGAWVVSERSMQLAIGTVEYSNKIHILLNAHIYESTFRPEPPATRTIFYSDLTDTTLSLEKMKVFAKHINNIFTATKKYNDNQVRTLFFNIYNFFHFSILLHKVLIQDVAKQKYFPFSTKEMKKEVMST